MEFGKYSIVFRLIIWKAFYMKSYIELFSCRFLGYIKKVIELWSALAPSLLTVILTYNCFTVGKTRGNCSKFVWLNPSLNNVNHLSLLLYNDLLK